MFWIRDVLALDLLDRAREKKHMEFFQKKFSKIHRRSLRSINSGHALRSGRSGKAGIALWTWESGLAWQAGVAGLTLLTRETGHAKVA